MKSSGELRKVCVVVNSRANYGRIKSVLEAIKAHPQLELQLITGASALLQPRERWRACVILPGGHRE